MTPADQPEWTFAAAHVPALVGQGLLFGDVARADEIEQSLRSAGYRVVVLSGVDLQDGGSARAAIVRALDLPASAESNADAFADALGDLSCPEGRLALVWRDADALAAADLPGWTQLAYQLQQASDEAWSMDDGSDSQTDPQGTGLVFEVVALIATDHVEQQVRGVRPGTGTAVR